MGALKLLIIIFLNIYIAYPAQQNTVLLIKKGDSITISKYEKNEFYLTVFNKKAIMHNKKLKNTKRVDGITDCEFCENESFTFIVKKTNKPRNISKVISLQEYVKNRNLFFYSGYFLIDDTFFVNLGRISY